MEPRKPQNPGQRHPRRKEAGNPSSLSEVRGILGLGGGLLFVRLWFKSPANLITITDRIFIIMIDNDSLWHLHLELVAIIAEELGRLVALVADCTFLVALVRIVGIEMFPRRGLGKLFVGAAVTLQTFIHFRSLRAHLFDVALSALDIPLSVTVSEVITSFSVRGKRKACGPKNRSKNIHFHHHFSSGFG
jgi:hypothetical protein